MKGLSGIFFIDLTEIEHSLMILSILCKKGLFAQM